MKIGVIGGTFDPIHFGHLAIAKAALEEYKLDRLWFMPAGDPYFKEGSNVTSPQLRLQMTQIGIKGYCDIFECSDYEIKDHNKTYSAVTFDKLHKEYPEDEFYFIIGLDSLRSMKNWYKPELLLENTIILCAARNDELSRGYQIFNIINEIKTAFAEQKPDIRIIHTAMIDLSSTIVRNAVHNGDDISAYVPQKVADFIKEHKLYSDFSAIEKNNTHFS